MCPRRRKRSQWTTTTRATMIHAEAPAAEAAVLPTAVPAIHALMATTAGMRMRLIRTILFPWMTAWTTGAVPQYVCRAQPGFLRLRIWKVLFRRQTGNCPDAENQHGMAHQLRFLPRYGRRAVRDAGNCGLSLLFQVVDARSPAIPASHGQLYSAPFRSGAGG